MRYRVDHIPKCTPCDRRPRSPMKPEYLTIHNTGNSRSTARNERAWLTNPTNKRTASYHIVVDEKEAIECIPLNEVAWHAGDGNGDGNMRSIGIEMCESGNYAKTLDNAMNLVAKMLIERGWGVDRLRRHYDWSEKICPRLMYDNGTWKGWYTFKLEVEKRMKSVKVFVNGKRIADGKVIQGVTYLPARALAEALGADVKWCGKENKVDIEKK